MYFDIGIDREIILKSAGYEPIGRGIFFRRMINDRSWFHAILAHDGVGVNIHKDIAKTNAGNNGKTIFQCHTSIHRSGTIEDEFKRIMQNYGIQN